MPFVNLASITPTRVKWLWPGRLPLGYLVMLDGDPGSGKSFLTIDLCARLSAGQPFPDGQPSSGPASVILLASEDGLSDVIHGRLRAAGADMSRVDAFKRELGETPIRFPDSVGRLEQTIKGTQARYIVIDPITSFLESTVGLFIDRDVRFALEPLADLAARHQCVIHLVRHLNKKGGKNPLYRGLHSIGFSAMCRVTWLAGRDPHASHQFVLAQPKNNLDPPQPSLSYTIEPTDTGAARLVWRGQNHASFEQLLAGASTRLRQQFRAQDFLRAYLASGPRNSREIQAAAKKHRISRETLTTARDELEIRLTHVNIGKPGHACYWVMPGQKFTTEVTDTPVLDEWIRQWDEQYGGTVESPLDAVESEDAADEDDPNEDKDAA